MNFNTALPVIKCTVIIMISVYCDLFGLQHSCNVVNADNTLYFKLATGIGIYYVFGI